MAALYDSFIADYYDASPLASGRTQDVAFYRDAAREYGDPVLELGCGTGRVTMALAEAGRRVIGLDISERMLERAIRKRAALRVEARERVHFVQGDMTQFQLGEKFRLVIIPFRAFHHLLEIREQIACLEAIKKHLAPKGRLIVDFFQTDAARMHDPRYQQDRLIAEYDMDGAGRVKLFERVAAFHRAEQRNDAEMIFEVTHPNGSVERKVWSWPVRYFFRYEVEHLLARCGFRTSALYGDFDKSSLRDDSPEMIFVAGAA
jgi:ubiquinone/menaquinone biosynthesis C-methylase UbiE